MKIAFAPLTLRVPLTSKLLLAVSGCVTFESVRLKNVMLVPLVMLCAPVPLKLNVPVPAFKVVAGAPPAFKNKVPLNIYCAGIAVERAAHNWSRTNRQVTADVHRAVIHIESAAGNHHVSGRQRAAGVVGPEPPC